ncbi:MAG: hypothetical protein C0405_15180, partial [Desulfovibrio sp.]|nr:hypothetical protein [Desulfovibrio sp.]
MKPRWIWAALLGLALLPAPAWANPADDYDKGVAKAREGMKARDPQATLLGLRQALAAAWAKLPFTVLEVHLTAAMPSGFGQYITRVDNIYRPNEPLILYMEPVGYKVAFDPANSTYAYKLATDFNLIDSWGRVVSGRR